MVIEGYVQNNKVHLFDSEEYYKLICKEELDERFGYLLTFDTNEKLLAKECCIECWFHFLNREKTLIEREPHGN